MSVSVSVMIGYFESCQLGNYSLCIEIVVIRVFFQNKSFAVINTFSRSGKILVFSHSTPDHFGRCTKTKLHVPEVLQTVFYNDNIQTLLKCYKTHKN